MMQMRINLRPAQVRHGHHDLVPRLCDLDLLCRCSQNPARLNLKTLLRISTLLPDPLLSSTQRTHHSVLDALSAGLVVSHNVVHEVVRTFELPLAR